MFRFKEFTICQDRCPMKVGTDGVLLGAWAPVLPSDRRILDVGTGTGLIALMLAQRAPGVSVTGIDIDSVAQARENADTSPWGGRIAMLQSSVQTFVAADPFDLIVSNPPFFTDSLTCPDSGRTSARHTVNLPFDELCDASLRLLAPAGRLAVILPDTEVARFLVACAGKLNLSRRTDVRTTARRPAKRVLMEFVRYSAALVVVPTCSSLTIGTGAHEDYTPEYQALTRDFYLKF